MDTVNDKFLEIGGRGTLTTLATPGKQMSDTSIQLTSPTNWPEGHAVAFSIRRVILGGENAGKEEQGTYTEWIGIINGNSIDNMVLMGGSNQDYAPGQQTQVMIHVSSAWGNRLIQGLLVSHTRDGKLKEAAVKEALGISGTVPPDWNQTGLIPMVAVNNGQKETVINVPGDITNLIQPGTKVRIPRTGITPTQSATFIAANNQYASKPAPAGLNTNSKFTCEGWVRLNSYTANQVIVSQYNDVSGFRLDIESSGRLRLIANNGSGSIYRLIQSYQSIPLREWVHVSATLDVATLNASTCRILIDGNQIPAETVSASAFTSFTPAGSLQIGTANSSTVSMLDGQLSNIRIWNGDRTPQQVRDNMNQQIPGASTGLVASFLLNGSWNDTSGNNNHLTASGGALNSNPDNPFNEIEYGFITTVGSFSGGITPCSVFTGKRGCIPNETLGQLSYSSAAAPKGFPVEKADWRLTARYVVETSGGAAGNIAWIPIPTVKIRAPKGKFNVGYDIAFGVDRGVAGRLDAYLSLTPNGSTEVNNSLTTYIGGSGTFISSQAQKKIQVFNASGQQDYSIIARAAMTGVGGLYVFPLSEVYVECLYI